MNGVECPYCKKDQEINHDDGFGHEEGIAHEQQCSSCEKYFVFYTSISFDYNSEQADCLNGSEHKYKKRDIPGWPDNKYCPVCQKYIDGEFSQSDYDDWVKKFYSK